MNHFFCIGNNRIFFTGQALQENAFQYFYKYSVLLSSDQSKQALIAKDVFYTRAKQELHLNQQIYPVPLHLPLINVALLQDQQ